MNPLLRPLSSVEGQVVHYYRSPYMKKALDRAGGGIFSYRRGIGSDYFGRVHWSVHWYTRRRRIQLARKLADWERRMEYIVANIDEEWADYIRRREEWERCKGDQDDD